MLWLGMIALLADVPKHFPQFQIPSAFRLSCSRDVLPEGGEGLGVALVVVHPGHLGGERPDVREGLLHGERRLQLGLRDGRHVRPHLLVEGALQVPHRVLC